MNKDEVIEMYRNRLLEVSKELWKSKEKAFQLENAFTRACIYLAKGYIDNSRKNDFTVMQWEDFIKAEVKDVD